MTLAAAVTTVPGEDEISGLLGGLPTHPLVVHGAVVLLPLAAVAFLAILLVPRWRGTFGWLTMGVVVAGAGAAIAAKQTGEEFAQQVGLPVEHARFGNLLGPVAALFLVVAAVWFWSQRRGERSSKVLTLTLGLMGAGLAVACVVLTIAAGHTGATAVWSQRLANAGAPQPPVGPMPVSSEPSAGAAGISMSDVQVHATANDCWTVVSGVVYDLTEWIAAHPGGPGVIEGMCGLDATSAFLNQHEGQSAPADALAGFEIGELSSP